MALTLFLSIHPGQHTIPKLTSVRKFLKMLHPFAAGASMTSTLSTAPAGASAAKQANEDGSISGQGGDPTVTKTSLQSPLPRLLHLLK